MAGIDRQETRLAGNGQPVGLSGISFFRAQEAAAHLGSMMDGWSRQLTVPARLLLAMSACAIYLLLRNTGLFLSVPDEWVYSKTARLLAPDATGVPSYLYFLIYGATNVCGVGYLECARILNVLFMVGAVPFIYLVCRRVTGWPMAMFISLLAVLGPINTYTAYFQPESLYFLMFWALAWLALRPTKSHPIFQGAVIGAVVGAMALVKVHAVFLVPAIVVFIPLRYFLSRDVSPWPNSFLAVVSFISVAAAVRFGLGYFFAGPAGLSLFGQIYGSVAPSAGDADRLSRLLVLGLTSLKGHAFALSALYAVPLAIVFHLSFPRDGCASAKALRDIRLFTLLVFACLLGMTTLFSANAAGSNAMETISRLHMRYYNFALPLLFIVAAGHASMPARVGIARALPSSIAVGVLGVFAVTSLLAGFTPGVVDSPELRGLTIRPPFFALVATLGLISLGVWVVNAQRGARVFVLALLPMATLLAAYQVNREVRQNMRADVYANAGISARQHLGQEVDRMMVYGGDHSSLYRTLFYLDNPNATSLVLPMDAPVPVGSIPEDAGWILVIGEHELPRGTRTVAKFPGAVLANVGDEVVEKIDFTRSSWPGIVSRTEGLSTPEPWGTWSDGETVAIEFSKPLPRQFTLILKAHTIGNSGESSYIVVGEDRRELRLPSPREVAMSFRTDGTVRRIGFDIPWARSMKELGVSDDIRRLGIGFESLRLISKLDAEECPMPPGAEVEC